MNDIRLTRRGKIVAIIAAAGLVLTVNALTWGKGLSCDWRGEVRACEVAELP